MGKLAPLDASSKLGGLKRLRDSAKTVSKLSKSVNSIKKDKSPGPAPAKTADLADAKKPTRPSAKKRRFLQLLKAKPQRVENPADLRELQIRSVKKVVLGEAQLSRGQKKRLKKKERFLNSKLIEQKGKETEEIHRAKLQALREAERAANASKVGASVVTEDAMQDVQTVNS